MTTSRDGWRDTASVGGHDDVIFVFEDVTKQLRLDAERNERLDRITDAFFSLDTDWRITYINDKGAELLQRTPDELRGENVWDQFPAAVETAFYDEYTRAMETQEPVTVEEYFEPLDTWFSVRAFPSDSGLSVYFRDITERKLRELRYDAIFNQTFQFTGLMDPDGTLLEANETALEFGGIEREDAVDEKIWDAYWFQHGDAADEARRAVECARNGDLYRREIEVQGADRIATIDFTVKPVTDDHGNVVLLVPEGRDITTLKERERQLQRQNDRLEEFASVVSHDLRTPLTIVQGNLELARKDGEDEYFDRAERGLDRVEDLLEDLLTLAREGQHVSETESVSLELVSKKAWDMTATLDATLDVTDATVEADESRLRELLENLFTNAVEHVGTDVRVEVGPLDRGGFYVADDGPGIDESDRTKIFESGYSTGEDGTGLGLSIVRSIANAHGWEITLSRSDSSGARFDVTF